MNTGTHHQQPQNCATNIRVYTVRELLIHPLLASESPMELASLVETLATADLHLHLKNLPQTLSRCETASQLLERWGGGGGFSR